MTSIKKIIPDSKSNSHEPVFAELANFVNDRVPLDSCFSLPLTSEIQIYNDLTSLNIKKSSGLDLLSPNILKISAECICKPLTRMINYCLSNGVFPKRWKEAKIIPRHKSGAIDDISCYRAISILPTLSKIIERHISISLNEYLGKYSLISRNQSGFRKSHSCETSLLEIVQNWYDYLNRGKIVGAVFIDLRKAFDMVNHDILLSKLKIYKLSTNSLKLFQSYLTDRTQKVYYNRILSNSNKVLTGVPQGSILGPLLFLLFINDMFFAPKLCNLKMFADDATLYTHGDSVDELNLRLNEDLIYINDWCYKNRMCINFMKSKAIIFSTSQKIKHQPTKSLDIKIGDDSIENVNSHKILGITVDQRLKWKIQIDNIAKKVHIGIHTLRRIRKLIPIRYRMVFANAFILPFFDYCNTVWGGARNCYLHRLFVLQKRCARTIFNVGPRISHIQLFTNLNWMDIYSRISYRRVTMVFKCINGLSPPYIFDLFTQVSDVSTRNTRQTTKGNFYLPKVKLTLFKSSFAYNAALIYNELPQTIKQTRSMQQLKQFYITNNRL